MNVHSNAGLLEANSASARCWATKSMWENHQKLMMRRAIHHLGVSENSNIPPVIAAKKRGKFNHEPRILWVHLIFRHPKCLIVGYISHDIPRSGWSFVSFLFHLNQHI